MLGMWTTTFLQLLTNETQYNSIQIIEMSAYKLSKKSSLNNTDIMATNNQSTLMVFYIIKSKSSYINLFTPLLHSTKVKSLETIYNSQNWVERELSEMFGITITGSSDTRKLLLDYSSTDFPMLTELTSYEDTNAIFYNINTNSIATMESSMTILI